jgi:hypothetical protein
VRSRARTAAAASTSAAPLELLELSVVNLPANVEARINRDVDAPAMRRWLGDEVVLELDDDTSGATRERNGTDDVLGDMDAATFADAFREGLRAAVRDALGAGLGQAAHRSSEPFADPAARRRSASELIDLDPRDVRRAVAEVVPTLVQREVAQAVATAFARARGRVD